ncbi:MAG TPA: pantoate--beta-alanine ligase, partial [Acidobacteriaceae bacterium]|nr:pantoate--beta-alanine ligase [Acidobacteriaceae bacterium]
MQILSDISELRATLRQLRAGVDQPMPRTIGFVPTMGALHAGHRSLVQAARQRCDIVVVSIFVNPTQFGPNEDFSRYPRTLEQDCQMLEAEGVDVVFTPTAEAMYPPSASTFVDVEGVSDRLDGASRPGHFRGVATVVAKLFHIVQPDLSFFGQKDAAQVAVLRKMVRDLDFPLEIIVCPTVREPDGLAMSSRNRYLSAEERRQALTLSRALHAAETAAACGEHRASPLLQTMRAALQEEPAIRVDYVAIVDPDTLLAIDDVDAGGLLAIAAY